MSVTEASAEAVPTTDVRDAVHAVCRRARTAARALATAPTGTKDTALRAVADALEAATDRVVAANAGDLERGRREGLAEGLLDRLRLDPARIAAIADAVRHVAALPDPVGEVVRGSTLANGLRLRQGRVPMGVVGMIYEARPNVTVDAAGLVDLLVPRGGAGLIRTVVETATVPVIETGTGNCHVYVDAGADVEQSLAIALNAKMRRVSVCNAAETLLVHAQAAPSFLPMALPALERAGVRLHVD